MRLTSMLALALVALGASSCAAFLGDASRDASKACEKKDGASCFVAGNLVAEKNGGVNSEAVRLYTRGCAVRHSPSCEALANVKGELREQALVDACNGGDYVSCARRASEFSKDERGQGEARALRHSVCKRSTGVKPGVPAREIEGIAESCAALARMVANGEGGGRDVVAAAKLEVLASTLRSEALYQYERADDQKPLPRAAEPAGEAPVAKPKKGTTGGIGKKAVKEDPTQGDREKFRREYEARRAAREAWMAAVDASLVQKEKDAVRGDPTMPTLPAIERATAMLPGGAAPGASTCQTCADGCGSVSRCAGDDFVGGRCGHLRCAAGAACEAFDTCVADCTTRVETCAKACGECAAAPAAPPAPAEPPAKGAK
jgi:hypothetical protein